MSNFDKRLEEELAKLEEEKKKKKKTGSVNSTTANSLTSGRLSYLPSYNNAISSAITKTVGTLSDDEDDIAPVKSQKDDSRIDFFQKGSFSDGYQIGDVSKAILGTAGDAGLNVLKGIAGLGEGIGDLASYGIAGVADLAGKDEYAEGVRKERKSILLTILQREQRIIWISIPYWVGLLILLCKVSARWPASLQLVPWALRPVLELPV